VIKLNWFRLGPLGFKYSGMFDPTPRTTGLFWKKRPRDDGGMDVIYICSGSVKPMIGAFRLDKKQTKKFEANKLHLCPPGCCNPAGGETVEAGKDSIWFEGEVRSAKHLEELLNHA
jgi:hypothetical protein